MIVGNTAAQAGTAVGFVARNGAVAYRHLAVFIINAAADAGIRGGAGNIVGDGAVVDLHRAALGGKSPAPGLGRVIGHGAAVEGKIPSVENTATSIVDTAAEDIAAGGGQVVHGHRGVGLDSERPHIEVILAVHGKAAAFDHQLHAGRAVVDGGRAGRQGDVLGQADGEDAGPGSRC